MSTLSIVILSVLSALLIDYCLGEPRRWHPLVGFGRVADIVEHYLNANNAGYLRGMLAFSLLVVPLAVLLYWVETCVLASTWWYMGLSSWVLYWAIGWTSLRQHAQAVAEPLMQDELKSARHAVQRLVSRNVSQLDASATAAAATESVLENGSDAIFASIFWFVMGGITGVVVHRLVNTLDAMWGYNTPPFHQFGWAVARADDVLNFLPSRLTALSYALVGYTATALRCWRTQAKQCSSPNAGPVMAAGAGALKVSLGGAANYHGVMTQRPQLGPAPESATLPNAAVILRACNLVNRAVCLWCLCLVLMGVIALALSH